MREHFEDAARMRQVLREAQTGLWVIEMDEGKQPRMYADSAMLELLGLEEEPAPEVCYQHWYSRIDPNYLDDVQAVVERVMLGKRAEVRYPWRHPLWGRIYVRCGGVRDTGYQGGACLRGYHQNVTDTLTLQKESEAVIQTLAEKYYAIYLCNLDENSYRSIKLPTAFARMAAESSGYDQFLHRYLEAVVAPEYQAQFLEAAQRARLKERLDQRKGRWEYLYRNQKGNWRRIQFTPAEGYAPDNPLVIVTFDDQDEELSKRASEAFSHIAISHMYRLLVSVDSNLRRYQCLHYLGDRLRLDESGDFEDFIIQARECLVDEDRHLLGYVFNPQNYGDSCYLGGTVHARDREGRVHYYAYYAVLIHQEMGDCILFSLRMVDDQQATQEREQALMSLCHGYNAVHLFDLDQHWQKPIWRSDTIARAGLFPEGALEESYAAFIGDYVLAQDREKMSRLGDADYLRRVLSPTSPSLDVDYRLRFAGKVLWMRARVALGQTRRGRAGTVVFATMDIDAQKRRELEEQRQKQLNVEYQSIIQGLSVFYHSVFYVDLSTGTYQAFSRLPDIAMYAKPQGTYQELLEVYGRNLIEPGDLNRFMEEMSAASLTRRLRREKVYALEYRRDYGGSYAWMRTHVILAESLGDEPVKALLAAHSVEREKEEEEASRVAMFTAYEAAKAANQAKSRFLARMSHDVRTPMNAILGMTAIALENTQDQARVKDCLQKVALASRHLMGLLGEILDMSCIEQGRIKLEQAPFRLNDLLVQLEDMVRLEIEKKAQHYTLHLRQLNHPALLGDPGRIKQVLGNLLTNAVKYTPQGGHIRLTVQERPCDVPGSGLFQFTVEDDGIGMPPDFLNRVFEPFERAEDERVRKMQGSGLGMAIVKGLLGQMQGDIQAESELGKGTRFIVTLPLRLSQNTAQGDAQPQPPPPRLEGARILVVEDNELNMEITQAMLAQAGAGSEAAVNGREAVDLFTASPSGHFQAVLMDLQMPVMDGCQAARAIRQSGHPQAYSIPIVALSANAFAEDINQALAAGMDEHISKPVETKQLWNTLYRLIGREQGIKE